MMSLTSNPGSPFDPSCPLATVLSPSDRRLLVWRLVRCLFFRLWARPSRSRREEQLRLGWVTRARPPPHQRREALISRELLLRATRADTGAETEPRPSRDRAATDRFSTERGRRRSGDRASAAMVVVERAVCIARRYRRSILWTDQRRWGGGGGVHFF